MFSTKPLVFISYSRKDKTNVDQLRSRLSKRGMKLWMDTQDITAGSWRREIKIGLRHSNFFVACLSRNTAEPGEVLQFEYDSALEIQRERLEGEIYIIPVRLEPCEIPEGFRDLQCIDLYDAKGWDVLTDTLRSKARIRWAWIALLTLILALVAAAGYLWSPTPLSKLLDARLYGKAAVTGNTVQLGVTLWKMEPSEDSDPPSIREIVQLPPSGKGEADSGDLTPVRLPPGATFRLNDEFQVGIESSRLGYLYVVNRSFRKDGSEGPASLIFPTLRIRGGDNEIWAGRMIRLPARSSNPSYWIFQSNRPDYAGESLLILLTPQPLAGIAPQKEAAPIDEATIARWNQQFGGGVRLKTYEAPELRLTPQEADARDQGTQLTRTAPPPEFIFEASRAPGTAVFCTLKIPLRTQP